MHHHAMHREVHITADAEIGRALTTSSAAGKDRTPESGMTDGKREGD